MSFIQNLFTSRDNNANAATYVGQQDRIWWDPVTNAFYASNGNTAGGVPIGVSGNIAVNNFTANSGTIDGNLIVVGNISPAGSNKIGGIFPGPGVVIGNTGQLTIDSANLPVSFGDFYANNNVLSIINVDENMILSTQGSAEVQLVGNIGFYKPDGIPPNISNRYASFGADGIVTIKVTAVGTQGAFNIIGSTTGNEISPGQTGAMVHVTGQLADPCRVYFDGNDNYVSLVARRWNGNVAVPTQVLAGEDVLRINSTATTDAGLGNVGMAQIRMTALENQTTTAQGSSITFTVTPVGSPASAHVTVANGVWATKFTSSGTVSATGNITGGNVSGTNLTGTLLTASQPNITAVGTLSSLGVTANITGGNILTAGIVSSTGNATYGNILTGGIISATGNASAGNLNIATSGTITTPRIVYNDGGIRTLTGNTAVTLDFATDSMVSLTNPTNTVTITLQNYVAGAIVKFIYSSATARTINMGVAAAVNSTTGATSITTGGGGIGANQSVILTYYCVGGTAGTTYVSASYT